MLSSRLMGLSQSSVLCFVIDTRGSMSDDIIEAKRVSFSIIESKKGTKEEPSAYILVPFNDPGVCLPGCLPICLSVCLPSFLPGDITSTNFILLFYVHSPLCLFCDVQMLARCSSQRMQMCLKPGSTAWQHLEEMIYQDSACLDCRWDSVSISPL